MEGTAAYSEQELLQRIAEGDGVAFAALFDTYYPLLFAYIQRITRSEAETESILQDVFLKIWMGREALQYVENFKPYLWVMARHRALNALRDTARRELALAGYAATAPIDPDRLQEHRLGLIDEAIANLPEPWRQVWLLQRQSRLPQAEIAEQLGIALPTVKKHMQKAVAFITQYVRERSSLGEALFILLSVFFQKK